ncbi:hypothetical protein TSAR_004959 [Trichomalopsis sarcophagae]|uniref:Uncharacterized protein n=1 Tax=Trichomalopsis sarcophagae TaxID=543379 RepID=A0A232F7Q9_9HYME|nr:hypothetical protein TSAR_004959 [Trichomalopsis sarcophagae]
MVQKSTTLVTDRRDLTAYFSHTVL